MAAQTHNIESMTSGWPDSNSGFPSRQNTFGSSVSVDASYWHLNGAGKSSPTRPRAFFDGQKSAITSNPATLLQKSHTGSSSHHNNRDGAAADSSNIPGSRFGAVGADVRSSRPSSVNHDIAGPPDYHIPGPASSSAPFNARSGRSAMGDIEAPMRSPENGNYVAHPVAAATAWTNPDFVSDLRRQTETASNDGYPPVTTADAKFMNTQRVFAPSSTKPSTSTQAFSMAPLASALPAAYNNPAWSSRPSSTSNEYTGTARPTVNNILPHQITAQQMVQQQIAYQLATQQLAAQQMPQHLMQPMSQQLGANVMMSPATAMFSNMEYQQALQQQALNASSMGYAAPDMVKLPGMYNIINPSAQAYNVTGLGMYAQFNPQLQALNNGLPVLPSFDPRAATNNAQSSAAPHATFGFSSNDNNSNNRTSVSTVLQDFQQAKNGGMQMELKSIYGHVVEFTGDQNGSRFIQEKLAQANSEEKDQLFKEIYPNAIPIMRDLFGNYVIQKFFDHGSQVQKKMLAELMLGRIVDLSQNSYACRVVQKALEQVLADQRQLFIDEIEENVMKLVMDAHGNHVVQRAIEVCPAQQVRFLVKAFNGRFYQLAIDQYVCRVVQRMLERFTAEDKRVILGELLTSAGKLIVNQYGNYVLQHVMVYGNAQDRREIAKVVLAQLPTLSKHKYASNVVENVIKNREEGTNALRRAILEKVRSSVDGRPLLPILMKDSFGNYVIQTLLMSLEGAERSSFAAEISEQISKLGASLAAKQLQALENKLGALRASEKLDHVTPASTPATTPDPSSPSERKAPVSYTQAVMSGIAANSSARRNA
ncbi:mRNA binding protein puf3 [Ceratocystis pirilliformis]|uniref:mRNA binding protein puf3 n=1 Tax=Ceratocystis pirilliformis TaxID=259994 RepID=A0ABR3Z4J6_9PEZI